MSKPYRLAVVGATGLVGEALIGVLRARDQVAVTLDGSTYHVDLRGTLYLTNDVHFAATNSTMSPNLRCTAHALAIPSAQLA